MLGRGCADAALESVRGESRAQERMRGLLPGHRCSLGRHPLPFSLGDWVLGLPTAKAIWGCLALSGNWLIPGDPPKRTLGCVAHGLYFPSCLLLGSRCDLQLVGRGACCSGSGSQVFLWPLLGFVFLGRLLKGVRQRPRV